MSGTVTKEKLTVRHLLVVLTGIMITFGCSALCFSTWGLFQPVVAEGPGVEVTAFAMYVTVMYLTMTIASPFCGQAAADHGHPHPFVRLCRARGLRLFC